MNLYLIRHGESEDGKPDEDRSLTKHGVEDVRKMSHWIAKISERPSILITSPIKRAVETAELFSKSWRLPAVKAEWLRPATEPSRVLSEIAKIDGNGLALIGHLPNLGLVLGAFMWGIPAKEIVIPKCGVACVTAASVEPGAGRLKWLVSPDMIK